MKRKSITIASITIFSISLIVGLLIFFDNLANLHFVTKQKALEIAMQRSLCADNNPNELRNVGIHLLHVKNDTLFVVDERTMKDMPLAVTYPFKEPAQSEYVWEIIWDCYFSISKENGTQINFVDAITGKLLE